MMTGRKARAAAALAVLGAAIAGPLHAGELMGMTSAPEAEQAAVGDLLIKFSGALSEAEIGAINDRLGVEVIDRTRDGRYYQVRVAAPQALEDVRQAYETTPGVEHVESSQTYQTQPAPGGQP